MNNFAFVFVNIIIYGRFSTYVSSSFRNYLRKSSSTYVAFVPFPHHLFYILSQHISQKCTSNTTLYQRTDIVIAVLTDRPVGSLFLSGPRLPHIFQQAKIQNTLYHKKCSQQETRANWKVQRLVIAGRVHLLITHVEWFALALFVNFMHYRNFFT